MTAHEAAMVQKIFVLNFITAYLPIFLTAFVYVPFAQVIVPHLDVFQLVVRPLADNDKQMASPKAGFKINPDRLKKQVIYFTVTAQIVNFAMEVVVPYITRRVFKKVKEVKADRAAKRGGNSSPTADDHPEEAAFLVRVRNEVDLPAYDVTTDFREMVVQFGKRSSPTVYYRLLTIVRIFVSFLRNLALDGRILPDQQLDRAPWRCAQDRFGDPASSPLAGRFYRPVA
jgi:anoctamin-10